MRRWHNYFLRVVASLDGENTIRARRERRETNLYETRIVTRHDGRDTIREAQEVTPNVYVGCKGHSPIQLRFCARGGVLLRRPPIPRLDSLVGEGANLFTCAGLGVRVLDDIITCEETASELECRLPHARTAPNIVLRRPTPSRELVTVGAITNLNLNASAMIPWPLRVRASDVRCHAASLSGRAP
jgi:hypothetical protein